MVDRGQTIHVFGRASENKGDFGCAGQNTFGLDDLGQNIGFSIAPVETYLDWSIVAKLFMFLVAPVKTKVISVAPVKTLLDWMILVKILVFRSLRSKHIWIGRIGQNIDVLIAPVETWAFVVVPVDT